MQDQEQRGPDTLYIKELQYPVPPKYPWTEKAYASFRARQETASRRRWELTCALKDGRVRITVEIRGLMWTKLD